MWLQQQPPMSNKRRQQTPPLCLEVTPSRPAKWKLMSSGSTPRQDPLMWTLPRWAGAMDSTGKQQARSQDLVDANHGGLWRYL